MLDQTENHLTILSNFRPDRTLPKYVRIDAEQKKEQDQKSKFMMANNVEFEMSGSTIMVRNDSWVEPQGFWGKLWAWITAFFQERPLFVKRMSVVEFFSKVKSSAQNISIVEARATGYEQAMVRAKQTGQQALLEKLTDGLHAYKMETLMLSIELTKFVPEAVIVEFYKKSTKGLQLSYVRNFTRPIPDDVAQLKAKADELELFDNYVVLYYDPESKSYEETKAEKAARKDPILFGVLKGRSDLYVIGDWVDEMCDLTLDAMADVLGRSVTDELPVNLAEEVVGAL